MKGLVLSLMIWLGTPNLPPPQVSVVSSEEMTKKIGVVGPTGGYSCLLRNILLLEPFDPDNVWKRSVLVHELEHHRQCLKGDFDRLSARELERMAYAIQIRYLEENGMKVDEDIKNTLTGR